MREDDRDLVALFAAEPPPGPDPAFVAMVAGRIARQRRRRLAAMSAAGVALGLGGAASLALAAPLLADAGRLVGEAARSPHASWALMAAALALALGVPLLRGR